MESNQKRISLTLEYREDGGLRVRSDDMPGLILSGSDPDKVISCILPAWAALDAYLAAAPVER